MFWRSILGRRMRGLVVECRSRRVTVPLLLWWLVLIGQLSCAPLFAQLRIVTYNTANSGDGGPTTPRSGMDIVLEAIGEQEVGGIARPIDALLLQEQSSYTSSTQGFVDLLNSIYGAGTYSLAMFNGTTLGGGRPGLVYNTNTLQLQETIQFGEVGTSLQARKTLRYRLRPVGYGSEADFYIYNNHYKAGSFPTDQARREVEATALRANSDALGDDLHAIYAGDYNIRSSFEAMYQTLTAAGNGQAFDPLNRSGVWSGSSGNRDVHTQSPAESTSGGLITGGMDDRFDFQLVTGEFLDDEGLSYIAGSYRAFGNNGSHTFNQPINVANNTALPTNVLDALATVSDHLPVVADYQLPARMGVTVATVPERVLTGAAVTLDVTVENTADVQVEAGADELDYLITATGAVGGGTAGVALALGGGNLHPLSLATGQVGDQAGQIDVDSSSPQVANGSFSQPVTYAVWDRANGSFDPVANVDTLDVPLGISALGSDHFSMAVTLYNLEKAPQLTAALDVDDVSGSGDTVALSVDLAATQGLPAGDQQPFSATLDASELGIFSSSVTLLVSDEDLPGATQTAMTLHLSGQVALGGDATLDGLVTASQDGAILLSSLGGGDGKTWSDGDFDRDALVLASTDGAILLSGLALDKAAVPEPSAWQLLLIAGSPTALVCSRRRRCAFVARISTA